MTATLFYNPITLSSNAQLWLILPLLASVAIVYKTVRLDRLGGLVPQVIYLMCLMVVGLVALGTCLWAVHTYWPFP